MKNGRYQVKDIPTRPVLERLIAIPVSGTAHRWGFWNETTSYPDSSIAPGFPLGCPPKLALAKLRKLEKRGLIDGCACGCSGFFGITEAGKAWLDWEVKTAPVREAITAAVKRLQYRDPWRDIFTIAPFPASAGTTLG